MDNEPKKVLIAEDEKPLAKALFLKLKSSGIDPTIVNDGEAALSALKHSMFDLALLDLMMPKMNGFTVLEEAKKAGITTPFFVMSNLSQQEDVRRVESLGVKTYLIKSSTPLSQIVEKVLAYLAHPNT